MRTEKEFKQFFGSSLLPALKPLEARRKTALKKIILFVIVMMLCLITGLAILGRHQAPGTILFAVSIVSAAVIAAGIQILRFDVAGEFKRTALAKLVAQLDSGLSYDPDGHIDRKTFFASGMFPGRFGFYKGSDLVSGHNGGTAYSFSYLLVSRKRSDTRRRRNAPVFQGLFFAIGAKRALRGTTVVRPSRVGLNAASFLKKKLLSLIGSRGEEVRFDDAAFSGLFRVQSSEPGEARTILTPEMRQKIVELNQGTGRGLFLSFAGQTVYAALSFDGELFGAHLARTVLDSSSMQTNFEVLRAAKGIAETLAQS